MTRALPLTLFLIVIVSAEALAQRSTTQKPTSRDRASLMMNQTTTVEDRLQNLENDVQQLQSGIQALQSEIQALRSENDQLEAELESARSEAETARSEVQSVQQQLDGFTSGLSSNGGGILTVQTLIAENVVAETYTPGAGNIW